MIKSTVKYCIIALLTLSLVFASSVSSFAAFDWGQWLEDDKDSELNDAMTFEEMATVLENDRFLLKLNGDNGVFVLSDKANETVWRSNPENWKEESMVSGTAKDSINSQLILKCYSQSQRQFVTLNSYSHSCVKGGFSYEKTADGYVATYNFPEYEITAKIKITLTNTGLEAVFFSDGFSDTNNYRVHEMTVLPYFLSAGKNDTGYIFVPDGSGAVITLNKDYSDAAAFSKRVYGNSYSAINDPKDKIKVMLPVYALTKNEQSVMAVIEKGDALTNIFAAVKGQVNCQNTVYATYILRDYAFYSAGAYGATDFDVFEKGELKQKEYKTVYTFFEKGKTSYTDIANAFGDKYIKNENLYKYNAVIDVLAATRKIKSFLGVPITQTEVTTSVDELSAMLDALYKNGAKGLAVRYNGADSASLKNNVYSKLKIDGKVGSLKEIDSIANRELERNGKIYVSYNPVRFVKGLFTSAKKVSRDLLGQFIVLKTYKPSGVVNVDAKQFVLLKPSRFLEMIEKLAFSLDGKSFGLAPQNITSDIYTDYSPDSGNATYTMDIFKEGLGLLSSKVGIMSDAAGFFAMSNSEINVDVPVSSSDFDLFDRSVPFYETVIGGRIPFSYESINYSADTDTAFLKCIETGALPKYSLYSRDKALLRDSTDTDWFSGNFGEWSDTVSAQLNEWNKVSEKIASRGILSHTKLVDGVFETVFDSGYKVVVNYNDSDYTSENVSVTAKGYKIEEGMAS